MLTLFDGFRTAVNALRATGEALAISQQNLTNVGVKGYARQKVNPTTASLNPAAGLGGGVSNVNVQSMRSQFAEQTVWGQSSQKGFYDAFTKAATGLDELIGLNNVDGSSGVHGALSQLYQSFSQLQANAGSPPHQGDTIQKARALALTISQTAGYLQHSAATTRTQIEHTVTRINQLVSGVRQWNQQSPPGTAVDPIAEAGLYANLESLSELVPINVQHGDDGSISILMNGQIPLLQGTQEFPLSVSLVAPDADAEFPDAAATIRIASSDGQDITDSIQGGQLAGLVDYADRILPSLLGDGRQQGDLNRLAQGIADSVNNAIGGPKPLLNYDDADPGNIAASLTVASDFSTADLADAIAADPELVQNLAKISSGVNSQDRIDGRTLTEFSQLLTGRIATELSTAEDGLELQTNLLDQAITLRETTQGSTLEQEAVEVLEYQRAYQAAARMISVIDELTQTTIGLVR